MKALINVVTQNGAPIIRRETEKAILIEIEDNLETWFPKSQITGFLHTVNGVWLVTTPFMAKAKGLSYRTKFSNDQELIWAVNDGEAHWE